MPTSTPFRVTADVIEALETQGATIRGVTGAEGDLLADGTFSTDVHVAFPLLTEEETPTHVSVSVSDVDVTAEGGLAFTLSLEMPAGEAVSGGASGDADVTGDGGEPVYRDPEALREVYEAHDTFPEMTEALGVDVEPQTVRKHMIKQGIHEPQPPESRTDDADRPARRGDATGADDRPAEAGEQAATDGFGLPGDVSLSELTEAVVSARTLYDVERRTGLDREQAKRCLDDLGLLDLVVGRLGSAADDPEAKREEIGRRLDRRFGASG